MRTSKISEDRSSDYFTDDPPIPESKVKPEFEKTPQKPIISKTVNEYTSPMVKTEHETITDADLADTFNVKVNETVSSAPKPETEVKAQGTVTPEGTPLESQLTHMSNPYEPEEIDDFCSRSVICIFGACVNCRCCKSCV